MSVPLRKESSSAEDFDYTISFPNFHRSGEKSPLVFLFGWAGCQDRYLKKYSSIWIEEGCITIRYICPVPVLFWHRDRLPNIGEQMYSLLDDLELKEHPMLFHMFSGGGCMVFNAFSQVLEGKQDEEALRSETKGLVFDSCPARSSNYQRTLAFTESSPSFQRLSPWLKNGLFWLNYLGFLFYDFTFWIWTWWTGRGTPGHYFHTLRSNEHLRGLPQLYLFSEADEICPPATIESFVTEQSVLGADVMALCWPDSPHCQHLRQHPGEYRNAIVEFLDKVLPPGSEDADSNFVHVSEEAGPSTS